MKKYIIVDKEVGIQMAVSHLKNGGCVLHTTDLNEAKEILDALPEYIRKNTEIKETK